MSGRASRAVRTASPTRVRSASATGRPGWTYVRYTGNATSSSTSASRNAGNVWSRWRRWSSQMAARSLVSRSTSVASSCAATWSLASRTTSG